MWTRITVMRKSLPFSNYSYSLSSAWLWMDEFNVATSQLLFSNATQTPLAFSSSPSQLQPFNSHGAYEAVDAYEFVTGFQPPPVQVSRPILRTDSVDVGQLASFTCNATGGIPPFTYSNGFYLISSNLSVNVYPDPSLASFSASPSSLDEGQTTEFAASPSGGVGDLTLVYYNLPIGCESANSANLACSPAAAGTYQVTVTVTDSNGFTISSSPVMITVNPDPTANIIASPPSIDLGQTLAVTLLVHGGTGPFSYSFTMLPPGCGTSTSPELSCTPSALGNYTVEGFVSDATGQTSIGYLSVTVNSVIRISTFTTSPESVDLGEEVTLSVSTTGGAGPLTYSYSDLPTGCLSADSPTLHCTPSTSGTYLVKATVTDHAGKNATSSLNITVLPARVIGPSLNQEELLVGGIITSLIAISLVIMVLSKRRRGP